MKFREEGDSGLLVEWAPSADFAVAQRALSMQRRLLAARPPWLREAVPGTASLLVVYDPLQTGPAEVRSEIEKVAGESQGPGEARTVEIPVVYGGTDGPDLERVAQHTRLDAADVVRRHASGKYRVAFMGFSPGFPYLAGLPPELSTPRLRTPRPRVAPGSVGIAAGQTGIYPNETAGGWNIIGRTAMRLVEWRNAEPFLLRPGDRVTFVPVPSHAAPHLDEESTNLAGPSPVLELKVAGLLTTIQDLGRGGHAHQGVPISGAMDRIALRLTNLAAGNRESLPALEFTFPAPRIQFLQPASFSLGGADFAASLAGRPVPLYERVDAKAGDELTFERRRAGHWAYLAPAGGIAGKRYLGSAAADTRSGISRRLPAGTRLSLDSQPPASGRSVPRELGVLPGDEPVVRYIAGNDEASRALDGQLITLSAMQDRSGYRTDSPALHGGTASMLSEGIPPGTIQLPPDGRPIFLMADRPVTGGYPKFAFFASIDTRVIAQCPPGTKLKFKRIDAEEARKLIREAREALDAIGGA